MQMLLKIYLKVGYVLYSAAHNACIYETAQPLRIGNCIADAKLLSEKHIIVPCTVPNMQQMLKLGHEATSPILYDYDWPGKYKAPFDHQKLMSAFMTLNPRCFNLSDMGTGKTLSVLWALDYLMKKGLIQRALILSPLSTIYRVWEDEIFSNFLSHRKVSILYGDRAKRLKALAADADFYIVNHDGLGVGTQKGNRGIVLGELAETVKNRADINAVIIDEGSVYKDASTNRYKVLRNTMGAKPYLWWLTGTPVPVDPTNAWSQARIVRPDYQEPYRAFQERTMYKISQFKWVPKTGSNEIAAAILQPAIRFHRDDCLDLPDVMVETRDVDLSPAQKKAYDELKKTLKTEIGKGQITAINEATLRLKLIQIACGAVYGPEHEVNKIDCAPRLQVLEEVIEQANRKILIFAPLTSVINLLYSHLKTNYTVERVTGNVSAKRRNEIFRDFQQAANPRIIVADPGCMAHGLTLTAAATTIWYGPTDKSEIYSQANKRMDRPGQTSKMLIMRLTATTTEREIFRRLDARESMQGMILDLIKGEV